MLKVYLIYELYDFVFLLLQVMTREERWAFIVEWLDPISGITWKYQLFYYPDVQDVEMVGLHGSKMKA